MVKGQKWTKPKAIYRIYLKWWENVEDDDGDVYTEYHSLCEDILYDELDADLINDFYIYHDWLYWDKDSDWEVEKVEEIEIWNWKEFAIRGRWRGFWKMHGYGSNLHV